MKPSVRVTGTLLAATICAASVYASASPANASLTQCYQSGAMACLYDKASYLGEFFTLRPKTNEVGPCARDLSEWGFNNRASSLYNNSIYQQEYYTGSFSGYHFVLSAQSGKSSLSSTYNNKISSMTGYCNSL